MTTRVTTELLKDVATSSTDDGTSLDAANSGKVVQLNAQGAIPSVYFNPVIDQWRLTANLTGDATPIASNLSRALKLGGDGMTQASGVFTFPKTGLYKVEAVFQAAAAAATGNCTASIEITTNGQEESPTFTVATQGVESGLPTVDFGNIYLSTLVDVTATTSVKVRFSVAQSDNSNSILGNASTNQSYFTFTRIGDT